MSLRFHFHCRSRPPLEEPLPLALLISPIFSFYGTPSPNLCHTTVRVPRICSTTSPPVSFLFCPTTIRLGLLLVADLYSPACCCCSHATLNLSPLSVNVLLQLIARHSLAAATHRIARFSHTWVCHSDSGCLPSTCIHQTIHLLSIFGSHHNSPQSPKKVFNHAFILTRLFSLSFPSFLDALRSTRTLRFVLPLVLLWRPFYSSTAWLGVDRLLVAD